MRRVVLAALLMLGSPGLAASAPVSARLAVQRSGDTISHTLTLHNRLAVPFRASYVCTLEAFLVNAAGKVVRQHPGTDVACHSRYSVLQVPPRSRATFFRNTLPWTLSDVPPGVYQVKARLLMFHVPAAFRTSKLVAWSSSFTVPGK